MVNLNYSQTDKFQFRVIIPAFIGFDAKHKSKRDFRQRYEISLLADAYR